MPRFDSINFYQNRPKIKLYLQKIHNFRALGAPSPDSRNIPPHCRFQATCLGRNNALRCAIYLRWLTNAITTPVFVISITSLVVCQLKFASFLPLR